MKTQLVYDLLDNSQLIYKWRYIHNLIILYSYADYARDDLQCFGFV